MPQSSARSNFKLPDNWLNNTAAENSSLNMGFLVLITLLAAGLRLFALNSQSLWVDEIMTWEQIQPDHGLHFFRQILDSIQGPLYQTILWPLIRLYDTDWVMRLPAVITGILAIPVFGLTATRIMGSKSAQMATLLLAINPFHIWYSQEARGYSFLIFFSLLVCLAFLHMVKNGPRPWSGILFGLASFCAVLSNMSGLFIWVACGLGLLIFFRPKDRQSWWLWGLAFTLGLALFAPWVLKASGIWAVERILPGAATGEALRGETTFSPVALPYSIFTFFYGFSFGPSLAELHQPDRLAALKPYALLLLLGALPVGISLLAGLVKIGRKRLILLLWILVPVVLLLILAVRNIKPWNARYISLVLPWVIAVSAIGLTRLPRRMGRFTSVLLIGLTLWSLGGYYFAPKYAREDVRTAVRFIELKNTNSDLVLVPSVTTVFKYYYSGSARVVDTFQDAPLRTTAEAEQFLREKLAGSNRCWLVEARKWYFDPQGLLPLVMARMGHLRLEDSPAGVNIYSWTRKSSTGELNESR